MTLLSAWVKTVPVHYLYALIMIKGTSIVLAFSLESFNTIEQNMYAKLGAVFTM